MSTTQHVVIVGPNLRDQSKGEFHVHAAGCADLKRNRNLKHENQSMTLEAGSLVEIVDYVYPPGDFDCEAGEFLSEFHVAPCVELNASAVA